VSDSFFKNPKINNTFHPFYRSQIFNNIIQVIPSLYIYYIFYIYVIYMYISCVIILSRLGPIPKLVDAFFLDQHVLNTPTISSNCSQYNINHVATHCDVFCITFSLLHPHKCLCKRISTEIITLHNLNFISVIYCIWRLIKGK
jgi:TM2 domain-containing membrane protein YozV